MSSSTHSPPSPASPLQTVDYVEEESHDVVSTPDIDTTSAFVPDPIFSSSSRHDFSAGKIDQSQRSVLGDLIAKRMKREDFETKFHFDPTDRDLVEPLSPSSPRSRTVDIDERKGRLSALLAVRPSRSTLEHHNILKSGGNLSAVSAKLSSEKKKNRLSNLLSSRPSPTELVKKKIIRSETERESQSSQMESTKTLLSQFITERPNPRKLIESKIIADMGDVAASEGKGTNKDGEAKERESAIVLRFTKVSLSSSPVGAISCGFAHTSALSKEGKLYTWGSTYMKSVVNYSPVNVNGVDDAGKLVSISSGDNHQACVTEGGRVYTWGVGGWGRLGRGSQEDAAAAAEVKGTEGELKGAACGSYHTVVWGSKGRVWTCGWNKNGRCGIGGEKGNESQFVEMVEIPFFSSIVLSSVHCGQHHTIAIDSLGRVFSWGLGSSGQLGHGDANDQHEPKEISFFSNSNYKAKFGAAGSSHSIVAEGNGRVFSFGSNKSNELGHSKGKDKVTSPMEITNFISTDEKGTSDVKTHEVTAVCGGKFHSCLIMDGRLYTWGMGARGVLGHGDEKDRECPTIVESLLRDNVKVTAVAASWSHTIALADNGDIWASGARRDGKLGVLVGDGEAPKS